VTDPVPLYKQPKFLLTAGTIAILTGLLVWALIAPDQYLDAVKFLAGAYLGSPA
jgi:hypothetical protein